MKYTVISPEEAKAITGWTTDMDSIDHGEHPNYCRGYNFEVKTKSGKIDFMSATFFYGSIEEHMSFDGFYHMFMSDMDLEPTGRVIFRGYYDEAYDPDERDYGYVHVDNPFEEER